MTPRLRRGARGVSLTELMIATALLSVGIAGMMGGFQYITKAIGVSRARTLATNLGQEKVELLKNKSYYELLITTSPQSDGSFTPPLVYDNANYAPEDITIGGINFRRYTYVALAQVDNNAISTVTYTYPDTGLKQITVHVTWYQGNERKKWTLQNLYENPNISPLDASFSGTVSSAVTNAPIAGALVQIQENPDWNAVTAADGTWSFRVTKGTYTVRVSSAGWWDAFKNNIEAVAGSNYAVPTIYLTKIASGTLRGEAWLNPNPVISQVVISTLTNVIDAGVITDGVDVEYVELFNPTTFQFPVAQDQTNKWIKLNYHGEDDGSPDDCLDTPFGCFNLTYVSTFIPPMSYYLISNATSFVVAGNWINADAYYGTYLANKMGANNGGCLEIEDGAGVSFDRVAWKDNGNQLFTLANCWEGTVIPDKTGGPGGDLDGVQAGNQIVRVSSPGARIENTDDFGRAYDSDNNANDFLYPNNQFGFLGIQVPPHSTQHSSITVIAGRPGMGAIVSASDPFSGSTATYAHYVASGALSLLTARFELPAVTTGLWTVLVTSGVYYREIASVTVNALISTWVPQGGSNPSFRVGQSSHYAVYLESSATQGYVEGRITDVLGTPQYGIWVTASGASPKQTGSNGTYLMSVSTGEVVIIANPNNQNPAYIEAIQTALVDSGQVVTKNFALSRGGRLSGYVTTGTTPLPNVVVTARLSGNQVGSGTSDSTGNFTIRNLSTATYTVEPELEAGQSSNPSSLSGTVVDSANTFIGTFTISGAFGTIAGTVTDTTPTPDALVTSGALILASTATLGATPPSIYGSSAPAMTPLYAVSSKADGRYEIQVRGSATPYRLSIYYPKVNSDGSVTVTTKNVSGITVNAAQQTTYNITIP